MGYREKGEQGATSYESPPIVDAQSARPVLVECLNGNRLELSFPCYYAVRQTEVDREVADHFGWPWPDSVDDSWQPKDDLPAFVPVEFPADSVLEFVVRAKDEADEAKVKTTVKLRTDEGQRNVIDVSIAPLFQELALPGAQPKEFSWSLMCAVLAAEPYTEIICHGRLVVLPCAIGKG